MCDVSCDCEVRCRICGTSREPKAMISHVANHLSEPMNLVNFVWFVHGVAPNAIAALAEPAVDTNGDERHRELDLLLSHRAAELVRGAMHYEPY